MAIKKEIKKSEARILVLLSQVDVRLRYTGAIAAKLDIDYTRTLHLMHCMLQKKWVSKVKDSAKAFYKLTKSAPLEASKRLLAQ